MFQNGRGHAGIERYGRFAKADRAGDVDLLRDHVEPREGARQPATLYQDVALFGLDDVIGAERIGAELRVGAGDRCRGGRAEDIARRQKRRGCIDEGPAIDRDAVRVGDNHMCTGAGDCQRPFDRRSEGGSRTRHLVDNGAGVGRAVVQLDPMTRNIETGVSVVARPGCAGRRFDVDDDRGAGASRLADLRRVGMLDDAGDIRRKRLAGQDLCRKYLGRKTAAEELDEADMFHSGILTARRSNTGI